MEVFRDPDCTKALRVEGDAMTVTMKQIRQHLTHNRTLHYMHNQKCHAAVFTGGTSFTLSHDDPKREHTCAHDGATLGECIMGDRVAAVRAAMSTERSPRVTTDTRAVGINRKADADTLDVAKLRFVE